MFPREACWREAHRSSLKKTDGPVPRLGARGLGTAKMPPILWTGLVDLKTFQVFNQQPMVHIGLQREPSEASPFRRQNSARGRSRLYPQARLMLTRWKKYIPLPIINNQRPTAAVAWPEGPSGAWLCPLSHARPSLASSPSHPPPRTKLRESGQAREEPYFTYFLF